MSEKVNQLIRNQVEVGKKGFLNLELTKYLNANEFLIHTYLMNANEDFEPSINWIASLLKVSKATAHKVSKSLRDKGLLELMKKEQGTGWIWIVNNVAIDPEKHKEFLFKTDKALRDTRKERNKEIDNKIEQLEFKLKNAANDIERSDLVEQIIMLEESRK